MATRVERSSLVRLGERTLFTGVSVNVCKALEQIGIGPQRITYVPNGVDTDRFRPAQDKTAIRAKYDIPQGHLVILSLGSLIEHKQPHTLVRLFASVERQLERVTLVVAGGGNLLPSTMALARDMGVRNIRFLGRVDHLQQAPELFACSDVFIMTSNYEPGEPTLTVAEAMASGLPCIVPNIPNRRVIEEANCGLVVDLNDEAKAMQDIVGYCTSDRTKHAANARAYAVENLSWGSICEKYLDVFKRAATTAGTPEPGS
jgi:glycosyltransferase involved in cell wall biosynthesis